MKTEEGAAATTNAAPSPLWRESLQLAGTPLRGGNSGRNNPAEALWLLLLQTSIRQPVSQTASQLVNQSVSLSASSDDCSACTEQMQVASEQSYKGTHGGKVDSEQSCKGTPTHSRTKERMALMWQ